MGVEFKTSQKKFKGEFDTVGGGRVKNPELVVKAGDENFGVEKLPLPDSSYLSKAVSSAYKIGREHIERFLLDTKPGVDVLWVEDGDMKCQEFTPVKSVEWNPSFEAWWKEVKGRRLNMKDKLDKEVT